MPTNVPPAGRGPVRPPLFPGASLHAASRRLQGPQGRHMKCAQPFTTGRPSHGRQLFHGLGAGGEGHFQDDSRALYSLSTLCPQTSLVAQMIKDLAAVLET